MVVWQQLKKWARALKYETYALYLACADDRTPRYAKWLALAIVAYAVSPIDLIPDFIPVLGYVDDLILLPLAIALVLKFIPSEVMQDCRQQSQAILADDHPLGRRASLVIIALWILLLVVAASYVW